LLLWSHRGGQRVHRGPSALRIASGPSRRGSGTVNPDATGSNPVLAALKGSKERPLEVDDESDSAIVNMADVASSFLIKNNIAIIREQLDIVEILMEANEINRVVSHEDKILVELFITFLGLLKAKSRRHLKNFLVAATEDEWVDLLVVGKGKDTEIRSIDHSSNESRKEFGI
jgi:hypothetical protein